MGVESLSYVALVRSYKQYTCHVKLANIRLQNQGLYCIPRGDWFEYVSMPHYFAEILVYLGLAIVRVTSLAQW